MAVIQVPLEVPDELSLGLVNGKYWIDGGVIREHATGRLVKLLKKASSEADASESVGASVNRALNPKPFVVGLVAFAAVAVAGGAAYWVAQRRKAPILVPPTCVADLNASFVEYLDAARNGRLNSVVIERLAADLDAMTEQTERGTITVEVSREQADMMLGLVADYTMRLAAANQFEIDKPQELGSGGASATIVDLRRYLEIQSQIVNGAA